LLSVPSCSYVNNDKVWGLRVEDFTGVLCRLLDRITLSNLGREIMHVRVIITHNSLETLPLFHGLKPFVDVGPFRVPTHEKALVVGHARGHALEERSKHAVDD